MAVASAASATSVDQKSVWGGGGQTGWQRGRVACEGSSEEGGVQQQQVREHRSVSARARRKGRSGVATARRAYQRPLAGGWRRRRRHGGSTA